MKIWDENEMNEIRETVNVTLSSQKLSFTTVSSPYPIYHHVRHHFLVHSD